MEAPLEDFKRKEPYVHSELTRNRGLTLSVFLAELIAIREHGDPPLLLKSPKLTFFKFK